MIVIFYVNMLIYLYLHQDDLFDMCMFTCVIIYSKYYDVSINMYLYMYICIYAVYMFFYTYRCHIDVLCGFAHPFVLWIYFVDTPGSGGYISIHRIHYIFEDWLSIKPRK